MELVAIADPVAEALDTFGERHGVRARYADYRQMLSDEAPDIVSICTWHRLHAPVTVAACAARPKAVLCEKPMATSLGECDEMLIAAKRSDVKLAIAHQRRFNPVWTEARELILGRRHRRSAPHSRHRRPGPAERLFASPGYDALRDR